MEEADSGSCVLVSEENDIHWNKTPTLSVIGAFASFF